MRLFLRACVTLALIVPATVKSQCPDGSQPPVGRPCGASARVDTNVFVVVPFAVRGPPSAEYLGRSMVDLLHMALDGVGRMRIEYAPTHLRRLEQLSGPQDARTASGVALELGAGRVIGGTIVAVGNDIRIRADVFDAPRARTLFTVERRASVENLGAVVDSLASEILAKRLVPRSERTRLNVGEYATKSPKALVAYLVARQLNRRGERAAAADSLKRAISLDPDFGLAYLLLHRIEAAQGNVTGMSLAEITKAAHQHLARFPERVRARFDTTLDEANRLARLAWAKGNAARFPNDADMAFYLADAYFHEGLNLGESFGDAMAAFQRALALDDADPEALQHFGGMLLEVGDSAAAKPFRERCHAVAPTVCNDPNTDVVFRAIFRREDPRKLVAADDTTFSIAPTHFLVRVAAFDPALGLALSDSFAQIVTAATRPRAQRSDAYLVRSTVALARGQYALAASFLDSADAASVRRANFHVLHDIVAGNHTAQALAGRFDTANAASVTVRAWWSTVRGPPDSAEKYIGLLNRGPWHPLTKANAEGLRGLQALAAGDTLRALDRFNAMRPINGRNTGLLRALFPNAPLALVHAQVEEARGNHARARLLLADVYPINAYVPFIGDAEELRAKVALALGDTIAAKRHLRNVVAVWEKADPPLQPRVDAARKQLANLGLP